MSWWNPWGEARKLRASLVKTQQRLSEVTLEQLTLSGRVDQLKARNDLLSASCNDLIREKNDLRNKLQGAHIRDPKTGRIQKRGAR